MNISEVFSRIGVVDPHMLAELRRWGHPIPEATETTKAIVDLDSAVQAIREVVEGEEAILVRQTDMDVLKQYAATMRKGRLHLTVRGLRGDEINQGDFEVTFGRTRLGGDYIIPWDSESVEEFMLDEGTYLQDGKRRIRFESVKELFFGDTRAFMICTPTKQSSE